MLVVFRNHTRALLRSGCHSQAQSGKFRVDLAGEPIHGDAPGPLFPRGGATAQLHTRGRGLAHSIDLALLIPHLNQIKRQFNRLEFRFLRGSGREVGELLKKGEAELGIAAEIDEAWERLDVWPLFTEDFELVVSKGHRLADSAIVEFDDLRSEQLLNRNYCEHARRVSVSLREHGIDVGHSHEVSSERDLVELVEADIGVAMMPHTSPVPASLKRTAVAGLDARRTVNLYGVAGRQRTAVASAVMRMLRGADWREIAG
jgi:DNA-binding transcriptional LysR family regulator